MRESHKTRVEGDADSAEAEASSTRAGEESAFRVSGGRWALPVAGGSVMQVRIDYSFGLVIDGPEHGDFSCVVRISSPFRYRLGEASGTVDPEETERLAPLLVLHAAAVVEAFATDDGHLELRLAEGRSISVPSDPSYEAWEVSATNRATTRTSSLISLPGSGTAVFDSLTSARAGDRPSITIVHTRTGMLLTKDHYRDWLEVQADFDDYMASLGPYTEGQLHDYLDAEYPSNPPFSRTEIADFVRSGERQLWAR